MHPSVPGCRRAHMPVLCPERHADLSKDNVALQNFSCPSQCRAGWGGSWCGIEKNTGKGQRKVSEDRKEISSDCRLRRIELGPNPASDQIFPTLVLQGRSKELNVSLLRSQFIVWQKA